MKPAFRKCILYKAFRIHGSQLDSLERFLFVDTFYAGHCYASSLKVGDCEPFYRKTCYIESHCIFHGVLARYCNAKIASTTEDVPLATWHHWALAYFNRNVKELFGFSPPRSMAWMKPTSFFFFYIFPVSLSPPPITCFLRWGRLKGVGYWQRINTCHELFELCETARTQS